MFFLHSNFMHIIKKTYVLQHISIIDNVSHSNFMHIIKKTWIEKEKMMQELIKIYGCQTASKFGPENFNGGI